jgi:hypothetical protein
VTVLDPYLPEVLQWALRGSKTQLSGRGGQEQTAWGVQEPKKNNVGENIDGVKLCASTVEV